MLKTDDEHPCLSPSLKGMLLTFQLTMFYFFFHKWPVLRLRRFYFWFANCFIFLIFIYLPSSSLCCSLQDLSCLMQDLLQHRLYLWCVGLIALWHVGS